MITEILGNRRSFYEVQYMRGYFLAFLFLKKVCGVLDYNLPPSYYLLSITYQSAAE